MGWTGIPYAGFESRDTQAIKKFFYNEFDTENFRVKGYSKLGNTIYMAIENLVRKETFALVVLISFRDGEFLFKEMDETMGPVERKCPKKILKMLTPTEYKFAQEWRKDCLEYHAKRKSLPKYKHGDVLEFPNPIKFTNGVEAQKFILVKEGKKTTFAKYRDQSDMSYVFPEYRITKWKDREPKLIKQLA